MRSDGATMLQAPCLYRSPWQEAAAAAPRHGTTTGVTATRGDLQRLPHRRVPPQEADGIDRRLGFGGRVPDVDSGAAIVEVTGGEGVEGVAAVVVPLHTQHVRPCSNPQHMARIHLNS